jgi:hypothetical protein
VKCTLEVEILVCLYVAARTGLLDNSPEKSADSHVMKGLAVTLYAKENTMKLKILTEMEKCNQEVSEGIVDVWVISGEGAFLQVKAGW